MDIKSKIKVVFVDIDNTLLSFSEFVKETMKSGFEKYGLKPYTEDMFAVFEKINNSLWRRLERGELNLKSLEAIRWNLIFEALDIDFDGVEFERYFKEQLFVSAIPVPNGKEMLEYLSSKYILCSASNGPYEQQLNRLCQAGMFDYFKHHFISEKVGVDKPAKAFFDYAFEEMRASGMTGLLPEETMIIGDSMSSDMAGGSGYGMRTCLFAPGGTGDKDVSGLDAVIYNLIEIKDIL